MNRSLFTSFLIAMAPIIVYGQWDDDACGEEEQECNSEMAESQPCEMPTYNLAAAGAQPESTTNDWGDFKVMASYLYWVASLDELAYAFDELNAFEVQTPVGQTVTNSPTFNSPKGHTHHLPENWNSGFRVGLGYLFSNCAWETDLVWTRYRNASSRGIFNPNFAPDDLSHPGVIYNLWPNEQGGVYRIQTAKARWNLDYDTLDLKFGNSLFFGKHFAIAPHAGLRAAWINQNFKVRATADEGLLSVPNPPGPGESFVSTGVIESVDTHRTHFTALGFRIGADTLFRFSPHFSFFANAAWTLFIGHFNYGRITEFNNLTYDQGFIVTNIEDKWQSARMNVDTMLGIRWEDDRTCPGFHYAIDIGYELQWWERQNESFRFTNRLFQIYTKNGGDLMLHGLTCSLTVRF